MAAGLLSTKHWKDKTAFVYLFFYKMNEIINPNTKIENMENILTHYLTTKFQIGPN